MDHGTTHPGVGKTLGRYVPGFLKNHAFVVGRLLINLLWL